MGSRSIKEKKGLPSGRLHERFCLYLQEYLRDIPGWRWKSKATFLEVDKRSHLRRLYRQCLRAGIYYPERKAWGAEGTEAVSGSKAYTGY